MRLKILDQVIGCAQIAMTIITVSASFVESVFILKMEKKKRWQKGKNLETGIAKIVRISIICGEMSASVVSEKNLGMHRVRIRKGKILMIGCVQIVVIMYLLPDQHVESVTHQK